MDLRDIVIMILIPVRHLSSKRMGVRNNHGMCQRLRMEVEGPEAVLVRGAIRPCLCSKGTRVHISRSRCMGGNQASSMRGSISILVPSLSLSLLSLLGSTSMCSTPTDRFSFTLFYSASITIAPKDATFPFSFFYTWTTVLYSTLPSCRSLLSFPAHPTITK